MKHLPGIEENQKVARGRGRPTDYDPACLPAVKDLAERGATDTEIAEFLDINLRTLYRWRNHFPDFCHALNVGKEAADERVKRSFYQRANGFTYTEQQAVKVKDGPNRERVEIIEVEKFVPPDTTAGHIWLRNRKRLEFADTQKHEHSGSVTNVPLDLSKLSDEGLAAYEKLLAELTAAKGDSDDQG